MEGPWLSNFYVQYVPCQICQTILFYHEDLHFHDLFFQKYGLGPIGADAIFDQRDKLRWFHFVAMALEPKLATAQVGSFANLSNILPPRVIVRAWFGLVLASFHTISRPLTTLLGGIFGPVPVPITSNNYQRSKLKGYCVHGICVSSILFNLDTKYISFMFTPFWVTLAFGHGDGTAVWYRVPASYNVIAMPGGER